ncbi:HlyU family transcriptional regulator [Roseibium algae]|uniref:HlyU family transcriptional regulator n=1 Tax=Roseibium algae TaxID=3123038 RepID=A0ABU8TFE4_9HYPH
MLGKLFKGLFGSSNETIKSTASAAVLYDGYEIISDPRQIGGQWQIAGRIEKEDAGERKVHMFIRADTLPNADEASEHMVRKAKLLIDQQGSKIFE